MPVKEPFLKRIPLKSILGAFLAGSVALSPFLGGSENTHKAYKDVLGRPAICTNHTQGVKMGDVATDAQCRVYTRVDAVQATTDALRVVPGLLDHDGPLKASADFTFSAGIQAFRVSPMVHYFRQGQWTLGCKAFVGHRIVFPFKRRVPGYSCTFVEGVWACQVPRIAERRLLERDICLGKTQ